MLYQNDEQFFPGLDVRGRRRCDRVHGVPLYRGAGGWDQEEVRSTAHDPWHNRETVHHQVTECFYAFILVCKCTCMVFLVLDFMLSCFFAFLLFCFYAFMLSCFYASCFYALCFMLLCFYAFMLLVLLFMHFLRFSISLFQCRINGFYCFVFIFNF